MRTPSASRTCSCTSGGSREQILDIFEKTTGGRIIHSVNRIGGVKRDISDTELAAILVQLQDLGDAFKETARVFAKDPSIAHRLGGVGVLSMADARAVDAVGPMARASGIRTDTRLNGAYMYDQIDFEPVVETAGDCLARVLVRLREVDRIDRHHPPGDRQDAQGRRPAAREQAPRLPGGRVPSPGSSSRAAR